MIEFIELLNEAVSKDPLEPDYLELAQEQPVNQYQDYCNYDEIIIINHITNFSNNCGFHSIDRQPMVGKCYIFFCLQKEIYKMDTNNNNHTNRNKKSELRFDEAPASWNTCYVDPQGFDY